MNTETHEIKLKLYNEETNNAITVTLDVDIEIEPTEYESGHLFYRGGFNIENVNVANDFSFAGKKYSANKEFPNHLKKYIEYSVKGDPWNMDQHKVNVLFLDEVEKQIEDLGIEIPEKRYPGI